MTEPIRENETRKAGPELDAEIERIAYDAHVVECSYHGGYCRVSLSNHESIAAIRAASNHMLTADEAGERITLAHSRPRRYSTDITAAFDVIRAVMEHAFAYGLNESHESGPHCVFEMADWKRIDRFASTMPLAICIAALAALDNANSSVRSPSPGGDE